MAREYLWYLTFDNAADFRNLTEMLNETAGHFDSECFRELKCPDGVGRPAIRCKYSLVALLRSSRASFQGTVFLLREAGTGKRHTPGKLQFWPPPERGKKPKPI